MATSPEIWQILLANAATGLGAFIQSSTGFGMGLVAVPILTLIDPAFAPGAFLFSSLFQNMVMALKNRPGIRKDWLSSIFPGLAVGAVLAFFLLQGLKGPRVTQAIGGTIVAAVFVSACGFTLPLTRRRLMSGSCVAGLMSTVAGVPAKVVREVTPEERKRQRQRALEYVELARQHAQVDRA